MAVQAAFVVPHPPVIVPEIGKGRERTIQKTIDAYQEVARRIGELKPETIVVVSSHQTMYANYFHISPGEEAKGTFEKFQAGHIGVEASYDTEFVELLCGLAEEKKLPAGTAWDFGSFVFCGEVLDRLPAGKSRNVWAVTDAAL